MSKQHTPQSALSDTALDLKLTKQAEQATSQPSSSDGGVAVLRRHQVRQKLGISNSTLYAWIQRGILPPPISFGPNTQVKRWLESDIDAVLLKLARERDRRQASVAE